LSIDANLIARLPLPLAQLYRRTANAKTVLERHNAAFYLWEAALKLLGVAAVATYATRPSHDPSLVEKLQNLARPSLGHWWEFVHLLVPTLADAGDPGFAAVRDFLLGPSRNDLPRLAGLDVVLLETLEGKTGGRSTVRLTDCFDRLLRYRNSEIGHGASGQKPAAFYEKMELALRFGIPQLLEKLDVLAGRRLIYVADVRPLPSGSWLVERFELKGEIAVRIGSLELPDTEQMLKLRPLPERVYLDSGKPTPEGEDTAQLVNLQPLLWHDLEGNETFVLNARRGKARIELLSYSSGKSLDRSDLGSAQQELLGRLLNLPVGAADLAAWAARSVAGEELVAAAPAAPRQLGEFALLSELGRGGMGLVYRAWQPSLGRQVALKVLFRSGDPKAEARFAREIRSLGQVEHPNLVKVYTSGSEGDQWFFAMELIEGTPLDRICARLGAGGSRPDTVDAAAWLDTVQTACAEVRKEQKWLGDIPALRAAPPGKAPSAEDDTPVAVRAGRGYARQVVAIVQQVAEAAHALHERGIVHRDIKPGNILLDAGGKPVLMDLGLAQVSDEVEGRLTKTRQFVGTLRYASPEQVLAAGKLDRRADVYSLGATLWELLTLRPLFGATDQTPTPELMQRIQIEEVERPGKYFRGLGRDLEAIVLKCLEKDPRKRYATAAELARDLTRFLHKEPVWARPVRSWERGWKWVKRRPVVAGLAAVTVLLVLGLVAGMVGLFYHDKVQSALGEAQTEKAKADKARAEAKRQSALAALYRGEDLAGQAQEGQGMLWMARGLRDAPASDLDLQRRLRTALATTRPTLHLLEEVVPYPHKLVRVARLSPPCPSDPDGGRYLLLGGEDWAARLFAQGQEIGQPLRFGNSCSAGAFSPDGRSFAAGSEDGMVRFGAVPSGAEVPPAIRHGAAVKYVAFDREGKTLLVAGRGKPSLRCYDAVTHLPLDTPRFDVEVDLYMAVFSPDGTRVAAAAGRENKALVWEATTGKQLPETGNHPGPVQAVAFCPASAASGMLLATGCLDGRVRLWDSSGKQAGEIRAHTGAVRGLAFSADGRFLLSSSEDQTARVWDVPQRRPVGQPFRHRGEVHRAEFSPDGRFALVAGYDGTVQLWRLSLGHSAVRVLRHRSRVSAVAFSPDGQSVLTGAREVTRKDGQSQLWGLDGLPLPNVPPLPQDGEVMAVAFSPDGRSVLTAGNEGTVRLWNSADGKLRGQWAYADQSGKPRPVAAVAFSHDSRLIAYGGQGNRAVLRSAKGAELDAWDAEHAGWVWSLEFSPKDDALLTSGTRGVKLWLLQDGRRREKEPRLLGQPEEHGADVRRAVFSRDGSMVLSGSFESKARVWAAMTGQPVTPWLEHDGAVLAVALSRDGRRAATASADHTARLWDATTGARLATLPHNGKVQAVAFSPDGQVIATGCDDGTARLWDADTGDELGGVLRHDEPVTCLCFSPDGRRLLTGSDDHTARLWVLPAPLEGTYEQIVAWVQLVTGVELADDDSLRVLDAAEWQRLRARIGELGGPPP
jgi:WD40 repeat protein/serine/threonine protein kinase